MINIDFIEKLKEENKKHDLYQAFNVAYNRDFDYEMQFEDDCAIFSIYSKRTNGLVASYMLEDFDLFCLSPENEFFSENYYNVTTEKSRKIYLTFMKKNFKEYKEEFILNAEQEARAKTIEIISL